MDLNFNVEEHWVDDVSKRFCTVVKHAQGVPDVGVSPETVCLSIGNIATTTKTEKRTKKSLRMMMSKALK